MTAESPKATTGTAYESLADEKIRQLRKMLKNDPGLIHYFLNFIDTHAVGVPADQPGTGEVFRDYYTADPLTTIQYGSDPFNEGRDVEVDRDIMGIPPELDLLEQIIEAHRNRDKELSEKLEDVLNALY